MAVVMHILEWLLPMLYGGILAAYLSHFIGEPAALVDDDEPRRFLGSPLLLGVLGVHALYFMIRGLALSAFPLGTKAEFLSLVALSVGCTYAVVERRERAEQTGIFFVGIVFLMQFAASLLMGEPSQDPFLKANPLTKVHILMMVVGFAGLTVGALYAGMYLLLARQLKRRELGVFFRRLPPLMTLEGLSRSATVVGVVVLGLGLALGHYVALSSADYTTFFEPKIIVADIAWVAYFLGMVVARWRGLSGRRMGLTSVAAFVVLTLSMALTSFISTGYHAIQ